MVFPPTNSDNSGDAGKSSFFFLFFRLVDDQIGMNDGMMCECFFLFWEYHFNRPLGSGWFLPSFT